MHVNGSQGFLCRVVEIAASLCVCVKVVTTLLTKPLSLNQGPLGRWAPAPQLALENWQMPAGGFKNSSPQRQKGQGS